MGVGRSGFVQLRRGLSEHVRDGRLSFFEASLYVFILMDTNPSTGLCYGSAGLFAVIYGLSNRTCRDALEKLETKGYLKRFPTRGKHGSYPILVNKFICSDGAMKGKYVNCLKSKTYLNICYDVCDEGGDDSAVANVNDSVNEGAASRILDTREQILDKEQEQLPMTLDSLFLEPDGSMKPIKESRTEFWIRLWNENRGSLPEIRKATSDLSKEIIARSKEYSDEEFKDAVQMCAMFPFLRGENDRKWKATLAWLLRGKTSKNDGAVIGQVLNGKYGERPRKAVAMTWEEYDKETGYHFDQERRCWLDKNNEVV